MSSYIDLRAIQKRSLHNYLLIKHELSNKGIISKKLDEYTSETIAEMEAEDVAYVQKLIENLLAN